MLWVTPHAARSVAVLLGSAWGMSPQAKSSTLAEFSQSPQQQQRPTLRATPLTFESVATIPKPGASGLTSVRFSPDDRFLTYLGCKVAGSLERQLFAFDRETRTTTEVIGARPAEKFSRDEELRRERTRMMSTGVTSYQWAASANRLLVPMDGALFVQDGIGATPRRLFDPAAHADVGSGPLLDARLSDDGTEVCFVWDDEVCCCAVREGAAPRRVTSGARGVPGFTNGLADYCAQEEMDRYEGFWMSPDAKLVAFERVDESRVPPFVITHPGSDEPHEIEEHRYPFAGCANPLVRLGVASLSDGREEVWFDLSGPFGADSYLARVCWAPCGERSVLWAQVQSRDQRELALLKLDPTSGAVSTMLVERNAAWINLHDCLTPLEDGCSFLWASEEDGWQHLYVYSSTDGSRTRRLTSGEWAVEEVVKVDEAGGWVYFMANRGNVLERQLYRVRLDGSGEPERLSRTGLFHEGVAVSGDGSCFATQASSASQPCEASLVALGQDAEPCVLYSAETAEGARLREAALTPPEFVTFASADGCVTLHAALYVPDCAIFGSGPHPTVVSCYGGPHVQFVQDKWAVSTADVRAQFLRSQGYLVVKADNRGSARRGLAFEGAIQGRLGSLEVADQVAAVEYVVQRGLADRANVGIYGWSYGGYLSATCLAKAPKVFKCAVAGAPVTFWEGYDTHYTERYMGGVPSGDPAAWEASSVLAHVEHIEGALLLVHGSIDENVHFRHTARLAQALIEHQKAHDLLCFPKERHSPRSHKDRTYMEQSIFTFLAKWLGPPAAAAAAPEP